MSQPNGELISSARLSDSKRIQRMLDELGPKVGDRRQARPVAVVDEKAKALLMEYAIELSSAIIEASSTISKHRGAHVIEPEDINLILGTESIFIMRVCLPV